MMRICSLMSRHGTTARISHIGSTAIPGIYAKNIVDIMRTSYYIGISGLHIRQMRLKEAKQELDLAKEAMGEGYVTITSAYLYTLAEWFYVTGNFSETEKIITNLAQPDCYQSVFYLARLVRYPVYRGKNKEMAELFLENYKHGDVYVNEKNA